MATEYKLSYTASEINRKLATVDETKSSLENDYYTSTEVNNKFAEVNSSIEGINTSIEETNTSFETSLASKADLVEGKIPTSQLPDDIGGDVAWEDIQNKPFGETGFQIEWDTNPTDTFVPIEGLGSFYKVSDIVLTKDELIGATLKAEMDGTHIDTVLTDSDIVDYSADCYGYANTPYFVITTQATEFNFMEQLSLSFPSAGVWFIYSSGATWTYYLGKGEIKQLDKKYIPSEIGTWAGMPDKPFGDERVVIELPSDAFNCTKISSQSFSALGGLSFSFVKVLDVYFNSPEETYGAKVKWTNDGRTSEFIIDASYVNDLENGFALINTSVGFAPLLMNITSAGTSTIPSASLFGEDMVFNVSETGVYFLYVEGMATTESYENGEIKQIDAKYLPIELDGSMSLDNYYTKAEIDDIVGNCDTIINSINALIGGGNV